jgi:hypothetical protein
VCLWWDGHGQLRVAVAAARSVPLAATGGAGRHLVAGPTPCAPGRLAVAGYGRFRRCISFWIWLSVGDGAYTSHTLKASPIPHPSSGKTGQ